MSKDSAINYVKKKKKKKSFIVFYFLKCKLN